MIKTIIIDLDGPILDGKYRHYECYKDILSEKGFAPIHIDRYWEMKRNGIDHHQLLRESSAEELSGSFLKSWIDRIEERRYLSLDKVQHGAVNRLITWRSEGITLVLTTMRGNTVNMAWQLEQLALSGLFHVVTATHLKSDYRGKADSIRAAMKDMDCGSAWWIGDTEIDVNSARYVGAKVCVVSCGLRNAEFLISLKPDNIFPSLHEVRLQDAVNI